MSPVKHTGHEAALPRPSVRLMLDHGVQGRRRGLETSVNSF
jgi:hypothetical protein